MDITITKTNYYSHRKIDGYKCTSGWIETTSKKSVEICLKHHINKMKKAGMEIGSIIKDY